MKIQKYGQAVITHAKNCCLSGEIMVLFDDLLKGRRAGERLGQCRRGSRGRGRGGGIRFRLCSRFILWPVVDLHGYLD